MTNSITMSVSSAVGIGRSTGSHHGSSSTTTTTHQTAKTHHHHHHHHGHQSAGVTGVTGVTSGVHGKARHHSRNHRITDYHTEHDTDHNRSGSPRIGQRSQSLSALQPAAVIQPRMAQLETLEAKMASIEVSLSSGTPRRKKCLPLTSPSPARLLAATSTTPLDQLEGLRNALRDKENIIRSLRGQVTPTNPPTSLITSSTNSLISNPSQFRGLNPNTREILSENERRHLEERLQRLKSDTENKKLTIKNLKMALDKLDITDNIDIRIQQAELEYQLGREELNLLTLLEDSRTLQSRLDEANIHTKHKANRASGVTVHGAVSELGGCAKLLAVEVKWCVDSPRFGIKVEQEGVRIEWAETTTGLKKGDRLVEINGKLLITRSTTRDDLTRLLSACPDPAQLVILRAASENGHPLATHPGAHTEVASLRSELGLVRERAEEAQRAKDGLRADNLRLTHRISYLEEQVSELLESRRQHRHHNHHSSNGHHPPPQPQQQREHQHQHQREHKEQQVRVVTTTAVNNHQNVTNINIGNGDVQVFQKGPQVTALVSGSPRPPPPVRVPSSPCIAASDKYTTDEEQRPDSRRSTDIDEVRPSRRRTDARSVKSLDLDSDYHPHGGTHYAKPRKSLDYTSEPVCQLTRKRPTPPKKPVRLSLHRAQSLQSVENSVGTPSSTPVPPSGHHAHGPHGMRLEEKHGSSSAAGRKRTHRGERSVNGLRWTQQGLAAVAVHLHQRQTARWC